MKIKKTNLTFKRLINYIRNNVILEYWKSAIPVFHNFTIPKYWTFIILASLFFLCGCISLPEGPGQPNNPYDPNNPNYIGPQVTIISGPQANETVTNDEVTFRWQGNREDMEFRYAIDELDWIDYSSQTSITFSKLNEFTHSFQIQGRYISTAESDVLSVPFTVNAIQGPALFIYPKQMEITSHSQFQIELWVDDTNGIAGLSTRLIFSPTKLRVDAVDFLETDNESLLLQNGGQLIKFSEINNTSGYLQMDCAVVEGSPHDVSGTGKIARITFTHLSGTQAQITISTESYFENSDGQSVPLNNLVGSELIFN